MANDKYKELIEAMQKYCYLNMKDNLFFISLKKMVQIIGKLKIIKIILSLDLSNLKCN